MTKRIIKILILVGITVLSVKNVSFSTDRNIMQAYADSIKREMKHVKGDSALAEKYKMLGIYTNTDLPAKSVIYFDSAYYYANRAGDKKMSLLLPILWRMRI